MNTTSEITEHEIPSLTIEEWYMIKESLQYTKKAFETYAYPSYEIKQARLKEANDLRTKISAIIKELKAKL